MGSTVSTNHLKLMETCSPCRSVPLPGDWGLTSTTEFIDSEVNVFACYRLLGIGPNKQLYAADRARASVGVLGGLAQM